MTNTSNRPITVDGVRLDTLAKNITQINRAVASRRAADVQLPGVDGLLPSYNDNLDAVPFGLEMWVRGTDDNGAVPAAGAQDTFRANLDELLHLFGKRHALIQLQEQVTATATRQCWVKVVDSIAPDINTPGSSGIFTVSFLMVYGVWEDTATQDWNGTLGAATGVVQDVTTLQDATERSTDTIFLVTGPITNPRITDTNTGAYVQLNQALAAGQYWRVNVATWASRYGATPSTLGASDTTGTDGTASTVYGGTKNQAAFLPLVPVRSGGVRKVQVALSGTAMTAATRLSARTRRKFAA